MQMSLLKKRKKIGANFVSPNLNACTQIIYFKNVSLKGVKKYLFALFFPQFNILRELI